MSLVENVAGKNQGVARNAAALMPSGLLQRGWVIVNAYLPLLIAVGVYLGSAFMLPLIGLKSPPADKARVFYMSMWVFSFIALVLSLAVNILLGAARSRDRRRGILQVALEEARAFGFWRRVLMMTVVLLISTLTMVAALGYKTNITQFNPFSWDATWMEMDRFIHFGIDPWRLLHPVLGHAPITRLIDFLYQKVWFFLLLGGWMLFALRPSIDALQVRYLVAMMLAWILGGNLMAIVFSSAGPVYFSALGLQPDVYAPLKAYLQSVHAQASLDSLTMQQVLWIQYVNGSNQLGDISAFPSMHNAIAVLLAIVGWNLNRTFGAVLWVFAASILVGSIHLGWHYAVDSYAGILVAVVAWRLSRPVATWILQRKAARQLASLCQGQGQGQAS